ncbi:MAG: S1 RNA-binding domain-containing protein [Desulfobacterales bacterium]|nr:S1 RNA-binding domain-containing protein [Desulfobacterales bacterium]
MVTGTVVQISADHIMIDIGRKIDGQAPISEFIGDDGEITIAVGQEVEVLVESINASRGVIRLSKEKAKRLKIWDDIVKAYQDNTYLRGKVTERIKGGLIVDIGLRAFLPSSQATGQPGERSRSRKDDRPGHRRVPSSSSTGRRTTWCVSHREVPREAARGEQEDTCSPPWPRATWSTGRVKNITDYGAFIDLGGIDGLLHITDMSWGKLKAPSKTR